MKVTPLLASIAMLLLVGTGCASQTADTAIASPLADVQDPAAPNPGAAAYAEALRRVRAIDPATFPEAMETGGPIDGRTEAFLVEYQVLLDLLRTAATADADGMTADREPSADPLKDVTAARRLASLALLRARWHFEQNRPAEGVADLLGSMAVGRRLAQDALMIEQLARFGIEHRAIMALAEQLPDLPPPVVAALPQQIANLPQASTTARTLENEQHFAAAELERQNLPDAAAVAAAMTPLYQTAITSLALPPEAYRAALEAAVAEIPADAAVARSLAHILMPSLPMFQVAAARMDVERALLDTALAIQQNGSDALAQSHDPFGPGPFTMIEDDTGYTLQSEMTYRDTPVTLHIGAVPSDQQ